NAVMDFRSGRRKGEEGIAVVIDFLLTNARLVLGVGGAALLGIATLVVKRVSVPVSFIRWLGESSHADFISLSLTADLCEKSSLDIQPKSDVKPKKLQLCALTLQVHFWAFYYTRAQLSPVEVRRVQSLALDICTEIQGFLHTRHPDMPLGEMSLGGSLLDDLEVVRADHACLLVPLQVEASLWRLIPGEETLLTHPLHWMVRRINLEYFPRGRSYWDRFLVGGYLSSEALVNMLSKTVMETMNWPSISSHLDCLVRPVLGGPELSLEIRWVSSSHSHVDLLILEEDVVLTGQPQLTTPWVNAWHLSLYPWETRRLAQLDESDSGCRRNVLKTLKAVCKLNPALRPMPSAPLANLILHLSERESDWSDGSLEVRFQQCITELIGYLEQGALHSYFKPVVNLLGSLSEDQVDQMGFMLYCAMSEPEILLI
uniref:Mitochondrial elongation factor 1 n=1 Tax=Gadus morhua TaxID=8049 RepID=A0A8C5BU04_GADMO